MNNKPTIITISGLMVRDNFPTQAGTIRVYPRDDRAGRMARRGNHTNWGYSGYYDASIYDGQSWRNLKINKLVPYEDRSYEQARQRRYVEEYLSSVIARWKGQTAEYDSASRSFRIFRLELPGL